MVLKFKDVFRLMVILQVITFLMIFFVHLLSYLLSEPFPLQVYWVMPSIIAFAVLVSAFIVVPLIEWMGI